jgi:hypothetical protein
MSDAVVKVVSMLRMLTVLLLLCCGTLAHAVDRPAANYDEAKVRPYTLPDPLVCSDGSRVRDESKWQTQRRPELLELFARNVYGRTPAGPPQEMHWRQTSIDRAALGGKAVRKEITLWFSKNEDGPQMHLLVYAPVDPAGQAHRWPVFLGLNFFGNASVSTDPKITLWSTWMPANSQYGIVNHAATAATRGSQAAEWQIDAVLARGYAVATAYSGDLCPDRIDGLTESVGAMFGLHRTQDRTPDQWGAIGIWAWGLSRALDYIAADTELDGDRVVVHGHSRLGKAALWAAAQDERFAIAISNESGCGGAKLSRRYYGQTVADITIPFAYWFAPTFATYGAHPDTLPVDQHELLALIAPRPLYVASAEGDRWSDPRGEFLSLKAAEPVYALFGHKGVPAENLPPVETPVNGDRLAYHIRTGPHDITVYDWAQYLDFADRTLKTIKR